MAGVTLRRLLRTAIENNASDLHVQAGSPPLVRIDGRVRYVDCAALEAEDLCEFADLVLDDISAGILAREGSCDLAYAFGADARFRVNVFYQAGSPALAFRRVHAHIPTFAELNLPSALQQIACLRRGLVLVAGTTSSGKSTTIAAMLGHINRTYARRVITIEDPVEFVHQSRKSLVAQIEVERDTRSYEDAMRHVLRQDPDVLMVGEMRDLASVRVALRAADTGHMVLATVHATNAQQTVERIIAMFDPAQHNLLLTQLALNTAAVIVQRLAHARAGGRLPVCEIMRGTGTVRKLILENRVRAIPQALVNRDQGMQSFDQHLEELFKQRKITADEALHLATNAESLTMALRGFSTRDMEQGLVR
ncbi:MAG: PilT/PilU family type 4a pilus ATPase [Planctomycetes bacterium]|nr:PilT/PilU family type 4a pilus ATPase [Planctomycetota bacterium]